MKAIPLAAKYAPGGLFLLAGFVQIFTTITSPLTPWKGGGFGMFAVSDRPATRTWSADCTEPSGQDCRVLLPDDSERGDIGNRFRVKPDDRARRIVSDLLMRSPYVADDIKRIVERLALTHSRRLIPDRYLGAMFYRPILSGPPGSSDAPALHVQAVRLRAWRIVFDADQGVLRCEPFDSQLDRERP